jgi:hypothetical protein
VADRWLWAYEGRQDGHELSQTRGLLRRDGDKARAGELLHDELAHLREELDAMAATGQLPTRLKSLRRELDTLQIRPAVDEAKAGGA